LHSFIISNNTIQQKHKSEGLSLQVIISNSNLTMPLIKNLFLLAIFSLCLIWNIGCNNETKELNPNLIAGHVTGITDGDTFTLLTKEKNQIKIRLYGIDCPEKKQDFGQAAKQELSILIFNKDVLARKKDIDRYGRTVAIVYDKNNTCINEVMLESGLAWHYLKYDTNPAWEQMQNEARKNKTGLWVQPNPVAPWEWRAMKRTSAH